MCTIRLTPDCELAADWRRSEAADVVTAAFSKLPLQLQSDTQRKLELRESDMGEVCVPASLSNVGVPDLGTWC